MICFSDPEILSKMYQKMAPLAMRKAMRMLPRELAEDVVQGVFVNLKEKEIEMPDEEQAYKYVYTCVHHAAVDVIRKENGFLAKALKMSRGDDSKDVCQEFSHERQLCRELVKKLSKQDARVALLYGIDGCSQEEIAELLQVSRKTVQRQLENIAEKLKGWKHEI